jgi:carboxypeptidase Taq
MMNARRQIHMIVPMSDAHSDYQALIAELKQITLLNSISGLLGWDERTYMPPGGSGLRAEQSSMMARMSHERFTSPHIGDWLASVESSKLVRDPLGDAAVNVRETRRNYDRARRVPGELVQEMAHTEVLSQQAWAEAKRRSDFPAFKPWLEKILLLKRRQAACLSEGKGSLYDALLEDYEPGETADHLRTVFADLREPLVQLVNAVEASDRKPPVHILERRFPAAKQEQLARMASEAVGFDFSRGRLDVSVHPFCGGCGPTDVRITTRYDDSYFGDAFFGVLHESGHGMYVQGLPPEHYGTPRGSDLSLGIHESQSRLWENLVGRGRAFWRFFFPKAQAIFPESLADVSPDDFYFAINDVQRSLIRTESDEFTYNLHIVIRFELEQSLLSGDLPVADLPAAWAEKMRKYLGITPPDDARGCLQDVHWSGGGIGYFPTYTLGNLYAAQFFQTARRELPELDDSFARGDFRPLLDWLRRNIHSQGQKFTPSQLVRRVTGKDLSAHALLAHLRGKAEELYGVNVGSG